MRSPRAWPCFAAEESDVESWTIRVSLFELLTDVAAIGACLIVATVARRYWPLLQRYLVPNALVAGFLGLALGPEAAGLLKFPIDRMGAYVYHLLALTFIAVGLLGGGGRRSSGAVHMGFMQVMSMLLQGLTGLVVMFLVVRLVAPDLHIAAGMLLPLGFAMGPGIAYSIGQSWSAYGFAEGASVGLTLAAVGYVVAYFLGVVIVNRGMARGRFSRPAESTDPDVERTGIVPPGAGGTAGRLTFFPGAIEPLAFHAALIGVLYAATYWISAGIASALLAAGLAAEVPIVWSFHFILGNLLALAVRALMGRFGVAHLVDEGLTHRLTGLAVDFLIAASIMAISIGMAWRYALPIVLLSIAGTAVTWWALLRASRIVFRDHGFERFVGLFGEMTGTLASGLALVRITDPEYRSPVAQDLVLSSGMALALGFPLFVVINLPFTAYAGSLGGYAVVALVEAGYLALLLLAWWAYTRRDVAR